MKIIEKPNLPQNDVSLAAVGNYPQIITALEKFGVEVIVIDANQLNVKAISRHADMNCLLMPCEHLFLIKNGVDGFNNIIPKRIIGGAYPNDCGLNCLILGDRFICNTKYCDSEVLKLAKALNMRIIHTNQGYARCSVAVIDENSIITADEGICRALQGESIDILKIDPKGIILEGYDYGFIGGCCSKLSKDKILFSGKLDALTDCDRIIEFIEKHGIEIIYATDEQVFDFGGFIPLKERA